MEVIELCPPNDLDFRKISPRDEEENGDGDSWKEAEFNIEQNREEKGRGPDEGLGERPFCVANEILELGQDAEQRHDDDGRQNGLELNKCFLKLFYRSLFLYFRF